MTKVWFSYRRPFFRFSSIADDPDIQIIMDNYTTHKTKEFKAHGLRYTAAAALHELGCDWETIGAITGHKTVEMVRKYTEKKRRAKLAISRLNKARSGRKENTDGTKV